MLDSAILYIIKYFTYGCWLAVDGGALVIWSNNSDLVVYLKTKDIYQKLNINMQSKLFASGFVIQWLK